MPDGSSGPAKSYEDIALSAGLLDYYSNHMKPLLVELFDDSKLLEDNLENGVIDPIVGLHGNFAETLNHGLRRHNTNGQQISEQLNSATNGLK